MIEERRDMILKKGAYESGSKDVDESPYEEKWLVNMRYAFADHSILSIHATICWVTLLQHIKKIYRKTT